MTDFRALLRALSDAQVEYILVGDLDLLGEIVGGGDFERLVAHSVPIRVFGIECRCLDLDTLIHVKRAAGRPKDLEVIAELEAIREEQRGGTAH